MTLEELKRFTIIHKVEEDMTFYALIYGWKKNKDTISQPIELSPATPTGHEGTNQ